MINLLIEDLKIYAAVKNFEPDVFVGLGSIRAAHVSFLLRKKCINFDDTEHDTRGIMLYLPFVDTVCTPSCYKKDLGKKQIRFNGYKELAYLHPNYFTPNPSVLGELGLADDERFTIIRFVAWAANHDIGQKGISAGMRRRFVSELGKYGRVLITSESKLPAEFEPYRITVAPEKIHDLLYYAAMCLGEGGTMASEAAVLGTPAIYINTLRMGCTDEEEDKYGMLFNFSELEASYDEMLEKAIELLSENGLKEMWLEKRNRLIDDKINVTKFMVELIEKYRGV